MLTLREGDIDRISGALHDLLKGRIPSEIDLPSDYPQNELAQLVQYVNALISAHRVSSEFTSTLSRGDLSVDLPRGGMLVTQSLKNLQASLRHLSWKTEQIAKGDFTQRVDFMGDFSESFNSMVDQLAKSRELLREKLAAEAANRAKSAFLTHMSHEIRTPLNGILGNLELLLDGPLGAEQRAFAETARESGRALLAIVNDVLDLSRIEAGRVEVLPAPFSLTDLASGVAELMAPRLRQKGLELRLDIQVPPQTVSGDAGRIRQIVTNLLGNAVKFTERGHVALSVTRYEDQNGLPLFGISVEDTGIGIPREKLPCLFHDFVQVDSSLTRSHDGTGLGLAISRRLALMMGGDISVDSAPGEGSVFTCKLPLPIVAAPAPEIENARRLDVLSSAVDGRPGEGCRALLVEDNAINRRIGQRMLERLGCTVDLAQHGREALELLSVQPYDMVFMDCQMPVMDGYTATAELRRREAHGCRTPVVAMTAHVMEGAREQCQAAGMDDYLAKPIATGELRTVLRKWFQPRPGSAAAPVEGSCRT
ncbi:MAG: response regulator [Acidobacteriia bacterium]|nr:response regulator [Terriglobia bacterium]